MNYSKYIGLPYVDNGRDTTGVDCWGLARLFYKGELNIDLPSYVESYSGGSDPQIVEAVSIYKDNWQLESKGNPGDLCLFNILGEPTHVGIYIGDNKFLHCRQGQDSVVESLTNPKWKNRFVGFYSYQPQQQVAAVGAPHPLKLSVHRDWTVEGTTVQDFVEFVKNKYGVGATLISKIVVMLDGVVVPKSEWSTTVLQRNQQISYKSIAQGDSTKRMLIVLAAFVVAQYDGGKFASSLGTEMGFSTAANAKLAGSIAINMAGMALANVIAPIRPPTQNDPGTPSGMNLFTGANNQASPFGAIPVVLGKVRFTGMLGAAPYTESLTETNILNTAIVWGFGPLEIQDISIGSKPLSDYFVDEPVTVPRPVTLTGTATEYSTNGSYKDFDNLYGRDVEQQYVNLELTNNATNVTPSHPGSYKWQTVTLNQTCDAIDIVLSFPEGMRKINTKSGNIDKTTCAIEIQMRPYSTTPWDDEETNTALGMYSYNSVGSLVTAPSVYQLVPPSDPDVENPATNLYRYTTFCLSPNGGLARFDGAVTDVLGANPSAWLQSKYAEKSYAPLLGTNKTVAYLPEVPLGFVKLYTFIQESNGTVTEPQPNTPFHHLSGYSGYTGLTYAVVAETITTGTGQDTVWSTSAWKNVTIQPGKLFSQASGQVADGVAQTIWTSRTTSATMEAAGIIPVGVNGKWGTFLRDYAVWKNTNPENFIHAEPNVYFPYDGYYVVEAAADDQGEILIDGARAVQIPKAGYNNEIPSITSPIKLKAGFHTVTLSGVNNEGTGKAIAVKITYTPNNGLNLVPAQNTILTFGSPGFFEKRKDGFNWVHSLEKLPRARYQIRVRRTTSDETEDEVDFKKYHKAILSNVTGYDSQEKPMNNPPGCYLAKTAIRIQSSNKVNGSIEGINGLVQTITWDYDRATGQWDGLKNLRATNNPASLFAYVLMHPANAFRVTPSQIDIPSLTEWHNFCNPVPQTVAAANLQTGKFYTINAVGDTNWNAVAGTSGITYYVGDGIYPVQAGSGTGTAIYCPKYTYNNVLTNTQSVMDTLRDICAAGLASPTYIDGKWGVVIDKPRTHAVQHFTPHNSWGFEATKTLHILPHAFRVSIPDETNAYQTREIIIYNYGYAEKAGAGKKAAELFEQLTLPGVTNPDQAIRLARWHFAQIKYRPETYTLNVDFEHLVCTRGDLVKVTHDVPRWGTATGRLNNGVGDQVTGSTLSLTEPVYLEVGKTYDILIRTNNLTSTVGSGSVTKRIAAVTTTGFTDSITLVSPLVLGDGVETDNLFMLGEINKVSQDCIVTAVEPSTNYSARITFVDYGVDPAGGYNIYTDDLSGLLVYNPNISTSNIPLVKNTITQSPILNSVISDSTVSNQISNGNYQNRAIVSFTNPPNLPAVAVRVQFDIVEGTAPFESNPGETYITNKESSGFTFNNLTGGLIYKVRARYLGETNAISGPWSPTFAFTNDGKNRNFQTPPNLTLDLEKTYIVVDPVVTEQSGEFKAFAYRLYRDNGTADIWETTPVIPEIQSQGQGRLDLSDVPNTPLPRISETGVDYRVLCRVVDKTNNYSATSSSAAIKIKTIV